MCKPKKPKPIEVPEPVFLTNPVLDAGRNSTDAVFAARTGRSSLRIPLGTGLGIGFAGRQGGGQLGSATLGASGNSRPAGRRQVTGSSIRRPQVTGGIGTA